MLNIDTFTAFFMWNTIINGGLLILVAILFMIFPNFIYNCHSKFFKFPQEKFHSLMYTFFGIFKILFFVFNLVPYVVLLIIA